MRLWTIQESIFLKELEVSGTYRCRSINFPPEWGVAYNWMIKQMNIQLGLPKYKDQYPIWAWSQYWNATKRKPDLRKSSHLASGTQGLRIEFEKNENEVLLSDFMMWHMPLNDFFLAMNERADDLYDDEIKNYNLERKSHQLPKHLIKKKEASWQAIFDLDLVNDYYSEKREEKSIQGCLWEIKAEEIIKIDHFTAR